MVDVVREQPARMFLCACCRVQVIVCSHCDRGQRYCAAGCSERTRQHLQGQAAKRYQNSLKGRHRHAGRMRRWRARRRVKANKVTHQGCMDTPANDVLGASPSLPLPPTSEPLCTPSPALPSLQSAVAPAQAVPDQRHCHFCGTKVSAALRLNLLRWQRGPDP